MPQMAPIMWTPLFILIISLLILTKYITYFITHKNMIKIIKNSKYFNANWLW
uniref:ATP synthase F0 subunit 8 n=1 Tax=Eulimnogammarus verrucosus TaxID=36941 RepID=V5QDH2_EULVE|nr:ATP synthase F0 subunit 8 [Eulimnogammarus verrucosus]AHB14317.1 ATP synthase F0 subunit 8 [Eulimnogammarus verrucosus]